MLSSISRSSPAVHAALLVFGTVTGLVGATPCADPHAQIHGRVVTDVPLPHGETVEIVVSTWSPPPVDDEPWHLVKRRAPLPTESDWTEVARVPVRPDGRFEAPRPARSAWIRLRADGELIWAGETEFRLTAKGDPGADEVVIQARVGAYITLDFDLDDIATEDEIAALAGDVVTVSSFGRAPDLSGWGGASEVESGSVSAGGSAVLGTLRPGSWSFVTRTPASARSLEPFVVNRPFEFEVEAGERKVVSVPMQRGIRFGGRVVTDAGAEVEGAELGMTFHYVTATRRREFIERTNTDARGRFQFDALPRLRSTLDVKGADGLARAFDFKQVARLLAEPDPVIRLSTPSGGDRDPKDSAVAEADGADAFASFSVDDDSAVALLEPVAIQGDVCLPDGSPLGPVAVTLRRDKGQLTTTALTFTDETGRFAIETRHPGQYIARLKSEQYVTEESCEFIVAAGQDPAPIELVAIPAAAIRIEVHGSDEEPVIDPRVSVRKIAAGHSTNRKLERSGDRNGALGPLGPGRYVAKFRRDRGSLPSLLYREVVDVAAGELATVRFDCADAPAARVVGRVLSGGEPAAGVRVKLEDEWGVVASGETDRNGGYELASMATGSMKLILASWGAERLAEREVSVAEGPNSMQPIVLPSGRIDGRNASSADSERGFPPLPCVYRKGAMNEPFRFGGPVPSEHFSIFFLPDGEYLVTLPGPDGRPHAGVEGVLVEIRDGETVVDVEIVDG